VRIDGSVALITGGASGLGLATAAGLVAAGARVLLLDLPSSGGADAAAALGERATFAAADVTDESAVSTAVDAAARQGPLRIVVTCAGVATPGRAIGRGGPLPLADFERVVRVNLLGTFNVVRLAAARMREVPADGEERGVVITTASVAAFDGQIGQPAYAASKAGVAGMTLPLARELASALIRVVSIAPGVFETPMMAGLPEEARAALAREVPHPARLGRPAEFAALVRHVVENPMLNGETIRLDGAIRMPPR